MYYLKTTLIFLLKSSTCLLNSNLNSAFLLLSPFSLLKILSIITHKYRLASGFNKKISFYCAENVRNQSVNQLAFL